MKRAVLGAALALGLALPGQARPDVPVNLKVDLLAQRNAEKDLKAVLDDLATKGLDVSFKARPTYTLADPGRVRVELVGFAVAIAPAWYARYRTVHEGLIKKPFGAEALRHAAAYGQARDTFLQAECLDAGGRVLARRRIHYVESVLRAHSLQRQLFYDHLASRLPAKPPSLSVLDRNPHATPPWLDLPAAIAAKVVRVRVSDTAIGPWPVGLDPQARPKPRPSGPPLLTPPRLPAASTSPPAATPPPPLPSDAPPDLPPPDLMDPPPTAPDTP